MPWQPIVSGALAGRLRASLHEILVELRARGRVREDPWIALLYAYAHRERPTAATLAIVDELVEHAVDVVSAAAPFPSLYGGLAGVGWLISHVAPHEADEDDPNDTVDAVLAELLATPWTWSYDLITGLVGVGVYFLERLAATPASATAAQSLRLVVTRLAELATPSSPGLAWHTRPEMLPAWERELAPAGYYNLGVAHGVPGVIALLGQIDAAGIGGSRTRELLHGGVEWLRAQARSSAGASQFSPWTDGRDERGGEARLAWCYGDLGVAATLLGAARCTGESSWERDAIALGLAAATRIGEAAGARDACLCHGTAGIAHVFNRLFQATGEAGFREAAAYWLERTLEMRQPGRGIGGYRQFRARRADVGNADPWADTPGFLDGAAGVGLALLAATSAIEPSWDRLMLVSIAPAAGEATPR